MNRGLAEFVFSIFFEDLGGGEAVLGGEADYPFFLENLFVFFFLECDWIYYFSEMAQVSG